MRGDRSYSSTVDERSPLLQGPTSNIDNSSQDFDHHVQFCTLVGVTPHTLPSGHSHTPHPQSLYARALQRRRNQSFLYAFAATLINGLLLSQVVLGAALTALAASNSSRVLITVFGALNTVIAGVIAFLKSRGQPLRARMFRDDLDRVVDEIESSAVMWLGISQGVHGYDAIDTDEQVTVRSEVARLTRLYDRAVKANTTNDPDLYAAGGPGDFHHAALRSRPGQPPLTAAAPQPALPPLQTVIQPGPTPEVDESPATKAPTPAPAAKSAEEAKPTAEATTPAPPPPAEQMPQTPASTKDESGRATPITVQTMSEVKPAEASATATPATEVHDPDASPATAVRPPLKDEKSADKLDKPNRLEELRRTGSDAQALSPFLNV